jgi:hypothetical protein
MNLDNNLSVHLQQDIPIELVDFLPYLIASFVGTSVIGHDPKLLISGAVCAKMLIAGV